jgi:hypothetical protein
MLQADSYTAVITPCHLASELARSEPNKFRSKHVSNNMTSMPSKGLELPNTVVVSRSEFSCLIHR